MFARYYNSATGRFLSPDWSAKEDPVPYAHLDNPQSLNLYSYVQNNPLAKPDLDGHGCPPDCGDPTAPAAVAPPPPSLWDRFVNANVAVLSAVANEAAKALNHPAVQAILMVAPIIGPEAGAVEGAASEVESGAAEGAAPSMNAAQREAMRQEGIPTSQQPATQTNTQAGRQYTYEVPKEGGGTETKIVQRNNGTDSSHPGEPHVEAGRQKANGQTDSIGRPRLDSNKTKVNVTKPDGQ
jgi:RHS repeat-associated protein